MNFPTLKQSCAAIVAAMVFAPAAWAAERQPLAGAFESSVVLIEATFKAYDYFQPWNKPTRSVRKHALVREGRELVTTAQDLADRTLVRAQKRGRGRWYNAEVKWVDYHANIALLTVDSDAFWDGLTPAPVGDSVPRQDSFDIVRWRDGNLEIRRADFSKFTVSEGAMSSAPRIHLELNTELNGLGWAEPVLAGGKVVGLTVSKGGSVCNVMPMPFVTRILTAQEAGRYPGLGFFEFVWQRAENPATLEYLNLEGEPRGAIVIDVPDPKVRDSALERFDVILEVDGFPVDMQGDYRDPDYGYLMIEALATRRHFAGEKVPMKVLRDGKVIDVEYLLPQASYDIDLLPRHSFDREPEYLIAGGLVFQPLDQSYLRGWGEDWRRRAPFRLSYYASEQSTPEVPSLVILTQVLPDPVNVGYQQFRNLVVRKVNDRPIRRLEDVAEALKNPKDGVHRVEFQPGEGLQRLLLDAERLDEATARVLQRYGIPAAQVLHSQP
jgi:S1-C subfamily serine protease